jgi:hypothetical protein
MKVSIWFNEKAELGKMCKGSIGNMNQKENIRECPADVGQCIFSYSFLF